LDASDPRLTFGRFLADVGSRHAERPALLFEGEVRSYAQLEAEARVLARALIGVGVVKGARVAVWMANRPEWIIAAFAIGMVGGILVPVNTFASDAERDYILRHSDASLLLMQPTLLKHAFLDGLLDSHPDIVNAAPGRIHCPALPQLRRVVCLGLDASRGAVEAWQGLLENANGVSDELLDAVVAEVEPSDDGVLIYTSGTTAHPKGVLHLQRAGILQSWRFAEIMLLEKEDRVFTTYPFFWTAGIAMSIGPTFAAGGCLLLQETFEPCAALDLIESQRATAVHAWPHQQKAMVEHESAARRDLSSVRKIDAHSAVGKLAGIQKDEYGTAASYGLSETFTISSMLRCDAPATLRRSTSGKPLPGMSLRIVDPETGEVLPAGSEGEIAVRGVTLMRGYYKVLPELTLDDHGYFRTQDGGHFDEDGFLHWTGRLSNLIKTGGANVSPVEIENVATTHPDLKVAMPVGVGHPTLGEVIVLCAVPVEGVSPDEQAIRRFLRERLAAYKVPRRVLFFRAEELSYTGNQKLQVAPLKQAALARLEEEAAVIDGYDYGSAAKSKPG
jgi:acyl-CoA synthetase (AMP-forming)/AMP-acid ligase II